MYDDRCEDLARIFLEDDEDQKDLATKENVASVAQAIQDAIEDAIDTIKTPLCSRCGKASYLHGAATRECPDEKGVYTTLILLTPKAQVPHAN
jgi:hypothetical protein